MRKPKYSQPKDILLECGEGSGSRTFTSSEDVPFQLAHVSLDTIRLNKAELLIKFSSSVNMERLGDLDGTVRLQYELFRKCHNEETKSLGIWMFEEVNVGGAPFPKFTLKEETFSFNFCECANIPKCCEYFVTVTPVEITNAKATVGNGSMAVLSQSLFDIKDEYENSIKYPKPKDILLACGQGNGRITFREEGPPSNIAHVLIDTTCLNRPKVLIEFSSMIKIENAVTQTRLQFELFRVCGEGEPLSRGVWRSEVVGSRSTREVSKAFNFMFCECDSISNCCEYFVTVTPVDISVSSRQDVEVSNARIVAFAQSSKDCIYHDDFQTLDCNDDCSLCVSKSPVPKKILLECGEGTGSRIFTSTDDPVFQLAHVTIDTTNMCKPMVNIEFSSIISIERTFDFGSGRLIYELFRVCDNSMPIPVGVWVVENIFFNYDRLTEIFNFTFCECLTCTGCCDYFITATPLEISDVNLTVSNGRMAALAQEI